VLFLVVARAHCTPLMPAAAISFKKKLRLPRLISLCYNPRGSDCSGIAAGATFAGPLQRRARWFVRARKAGFQPLRGFPTLGGATEPRLDRAVWRCPHFASLQPLAVERSRPEGVK